MKDITIVVTHRRRDRYLLYCRYHGDISIFTTRAFANANARVIAQFGIMCPAIRFTKLYGSFRRKLKSQVAA